MYSMGSENWPGENYISKYFLIIEQDSLSCGLEMEVCVANQTMTDKNCLISCDGLYADITDDSLKQNVMRGDK